MKNKNSDLKIKNLKDLKT